MGLLVGGGYALKKNNDDKTASLFLSTKINTTLKEKPDVKPSRTVVSPVDKTGFKITLFQYQTCPFCCKVRAFLDFYGLSYDIVEVNPVFQTEIKWSSYKKVPILIVETPSGKIVQLTDSSAIISLLASVFIDKSRKVEDLLEYYYSAVADIQSGKRIDIINKYFLMYQSSIPQDKTLNDITEERNWRRWVDEVFVHTLSPNVYRTFGESFETFKWFSQIGRWEEYFSFWERYTVIYVGSIAMWLISKKLKKRYELDDDVRKTFYKEINYWLNGIKTRGGTFMGGNKPDLSDLAVFGLLQSIEGCSAFKDLLDNTNLAGWYNAMKKKVELHEGSINIE